MPSTREKKITSERGFSTYGAGGEPLGEPPGVPGMTYEIGGGSPDLGP
jgi:hypothetical protein